MPNTINQELLLHEIMRVDVLKRLLELMNFIIDDQVMTKENMVLLLVEIMADTSLNDSIDFFEEVGIRL